ncbi:MAG: hypothetical protein DRP42_00935 [Tenericutes bacterium]|nr:MAG: hypothetical protein DRP42_00935 [Mycoplasmatota bacterium]
MATKKQKITTKAKTAKKTTTKKVVAKKTIKKTVAKKTPTKKVVAKKTVAKKTAAKKVVAKKTPAKKVVAKKTPAKKVVAKKTPAKKVVAKKTTTKKVVAKKTPIKKVVAKKTVAKKTASKKPVVKRNLASGKQVPKESILSTTQNRELIEIRYKTFVAALTTALEKSKKTKFNANDIFKFIENNKLNILDSESEELFDLLIRKNLLSKTKISKKDAGPDVEPDFELDNRTEEEIFEDNMAVDDKEIDTVNISKTDDHIK